jgi:ABC-type polysaccharide/polyol phosphate transport system ATPase subunit
MSLAIAVENLSKKYIIGHQTRERYTSLRDVLANGAKRVAHKLIHPFAASENCPTYEEFWALKDITFDIKQGDRVGIIGRNGAGKSTLLKILSRITEPTSGRIKIRGRVSSLLEVGTGFHPELTGRENIFLNGAILGMGKAEIVTKFDEIVAFAEVEKFLDTPVKRYSSGMYVRLAFAVAAHLEPEILVIDEVLAVGDAQFQKKCIDRMDEVSREGKTVLFVSHNFPAVQRLCNRGILIESGTVKSQGEVSAVLSEYMHAASLGEEAANVNVRPGEARFVDWRLRNTSSEMMHSCYSRDECTVEFRLVVRRNVVGASMGFAIWSSEGVLVLAVSSLDNDGKYHDLYEGTYRAMLRVKLPIKADTYQLEARLNEDRGREVDRWLAAPKLVVLPKLVTLLPTKWHGLLNEEVKFKIDRDGS